MDSTSERKVAEELKEQNCNRGWRRDRQGGVCVAGARTNTEFKTPQVYLVASDLKAKKKKRITVKLIHLLIPQITYQAFITYQAMGQTLGM